MQGTTAAPGPLVVSMANRRYFTVASDEREAVYLNGSHIWNNLHDGMGPGSECPTAGGTAPPVCVQLPGHHDTRQESRAAGRGLTPAQPGADEQSGRQEPARI